MAATRIGRSLPDARSAWTQTDEEGELEMRVSDTETILVIASDAWNKASLAEQNERNKMNDAIFQGILDDPTVALAIDSFRVVFGTSGVYPYTPDLNAAYMRNRVEQYIRCDMARDGVEPVLVVKMALDAGYEESPHIRGIHVTDEYKDFDVCLRASKMKPNDFIALRQSLKESLEEVSTTDEVLIVVRKYVEFLTKGNENVSGTSW
jgi:hypothetical protein